jgi:acyl transferase domain-containing protein
MSQPETTSTSASTLKRAFAAIDQLQRELAAARRERTEPIAVVGLGCRFPGGVVDADSYWHLLEDGVDAITEIPADRWDVDAFYQAEAGHPGKMSTRWGGFIDGLDQFDAAFFGISAREAEAMDPNQRLVLEVSWEALENAGYARLATTGSGSSRARRTSVPMP